MGEECQEMWLERKTVLIPCQINIKVFVLYPESNGEAMGIFKAEIIYIYVNFENMILICLR